MPTADPAAFIETLPADPGLRQNLEKGYQRRWGTFMLSAPLLVDLKRQCVALKSRGGGVCAS
jgi:hypothetical protein